MDNFDLEKNSHTLSLFHAIHLCTQFNKAVQISCQPNFAFKPNYVDNIEIHNSKSVIKTTGIGLMDCMGILPNYILQLTIHQQLLKKTILLDFINIFNESFILLTYSARLQSQLHRQYELNPNNNQYSTTIHSLTGCNYERNCTLTENECYYYSAILNKRIINCADINWLLRDYFNIPVMVNSFTGQWKNINSSHLSCLGKHNNALGNNTLIGRQYWTLSNKITVLLGPLNFKQFKNFLPLNLAITKMHAWLKKCLPAHITYDIQLILHKKEIPPMQLGINNNRLGLTTWVYHITPTQHCHQYRLGATT